MGIFKTNEIKTLDRLTGELSHAVEVTRAEIASLAAAEKSLADAEAMLAGALADAALRADDSGLTTAREKVATRRAELEEQRTRLRAVRTALWRLGTSSAKEAGAVNTESLDQEAAEAVKALSVEWERATTAFGLVMARRMALERSLVRKLSLPDPTPAGASDVSGLAPIHVKLDDFREALGHVTQFSPESPDGDLEGEEVVLHRNFLLAFRERESAERERWAKGRGEIAKPSSLTDYPAGEEATSHEARRGFLERESREHRLWTKS